MHEASDRQGGRALPIQTSLLPRGRGERPARHGLAPTRALAAHRSAARLLRMVRAVRLLFPELGEIPIRVGLTRAARGYASVEGRTIWVNPYRLTRHTIAHELVHLLQSRGAIPGGEKTADLHALARHETLADDLPGYLAIPDEMARRWDRENAAGRRLLHEAAREALARCGGSRRRAIFRFERIVRERRPLPLPAAARPIPLFPSSSPGASSR